uniref:30S ribosomal protein S16 n=1 Tax=Cremastra appendiculata TaxID=459596 RepID=A0A2P1ENV1_9ASPA|nr:30S ribosomal protein S16 [Cremastra appendiculata]AVM10509.1 30S ribosomal protein S16 [Cremastra appendiculata]
MERFKFVEIFELFRLRVYHKGINLSYDFSLFHRKNKKQKVCCCLFEKELYNFLFKVSSFLVLFILILFLFLFFVSFSRFLLWNPPTRGVIFLLVLYFSFLD